MYIAAHIEIQCQSSCALPYWCVWWIFSLAPISYFFVVHTIYGQVSCPRLDHIHRCMNTCCTWNCDLGSLFKIFCNTSKQNFFFVIHTKSAGLVYLTFRTPIDKHYLICSAALSQPYLKSEKRIECYNSCINNFVAFTDSSGPESTHWSVSTRAAIVHHWYW